MLHRRSSLCLNDELEPNTVSRSFAAWGRFLEASRSAESMLRPAYAAWIPRSRTQYNVRPGPAVPATRAARALGASHS